MASYNKVILVGNLTRDPQITYTAPKRAVTNFGIAVNRIRKDRDGSQRDETCFVDCVAFGKNAELLNQYLTKGKAVLVEGRLQQHTWETKEGAKRSKHEIVVEHFEFLGASAKTPANAIRKQDAPPTPPETDDPPVLGIPF